MFAENKNILNQVTLNDLDTDRDGKIDASAGGFNKDISKISGVLKIANGDLQGNVNLDDVLEGTNKKHLTTALKSNYNAAYEHIHNLTTDIDHDQLTNTHNLTTNINHASITGAHNLTTDIDHDQLTNFSADEHVDHSAIAYSDISASDETTDVTGAELEELTDGSQTALHTHAGGGAETYVELSTLDGTTDVTGVELEELTDGSQTSLHSHTGGEGLVFVKRDNLAAVDVDYTTLTRNNAWQELDLSAIVPAGVTLVQVHIVSTLPANGDTVLWDNGSTDNHMGCYTCYNMAQHVEQFSILIFLVCDANRKLMYNIQDTGITGSLTVRGWFA